MRTRRSRRIAAGLAVAVVALGVTWYVGSDDSPLDSTADDGFRGLKLLLEHRGSTVTEVDGDDVNAAAAERYDTIFVLRSAGVDRDQLAQWHRFVAAGGRLVLGEPDRVAPAGGSTAPGADASSDDAGTSVATIAPGACTLAGGGALPDIHTGGVGGHHVYTNELSCYGDSATAVVSAATCRLGEQYTLTAPTIFDNSTMGAPIDDRPTVERRGNAALAALVLAPDAGQRVGVVVDGVRTGFGDDAAVSPDEPRCADTFDDGAIWQDPTQPGPSDQAAGSGSGEDGAPVPGAGNGQGGSDGGTDGGTGTPGTLPGGGQAGGDQAGGEGGELPTDLPDGGTGSPSRGGAGGQGSQGGQSGDSSEPTEAGTADPPPSMFDFLSPGLKLALAQLLAVLVWYAWRRSRRRGVVVEDVTPVALRSSRRVEAVGAFRRRGGDTQRAGDELRAHTCAALAADLGIDRDAPAADVAAAAAARLGRDPASLAELLDGAPVEDEDHLVGLASVLHQLRAEVAATVLGRTGRP